ncbi:PfkB family carbohydrate kinase [Ornithinimicrobium cerasi]|uniref:PfkB family carbohydrate kinase n=1 Tax=Ornithinimicrobium cerasi TaxID=2248773 RepID=UPI00137A003E|nr:PfkB family carbohydrate kinase [Ornithinimicrobium cerasi]
MVSIVAIGDNVTDCYVDQGRMYPGGNCVNVAVRAARAGARAAYVGQVGDDDRGQMLLDALAAEGVDTSRVRVIPGRTSITVVRHVEGERYFGSTDLGVRTFIPDDDDLDFVAGFDLAHTSYCSGLEKVVPQIARRTRVSYDFDIITDVAAAEELLPHVWVACLSASHLTEDQTGEAINWAHRHGPRWALATRGAQPAMVSHESSVVRARVVHTEPRDTLGAGDAFIARALCGILARNVDAQELADAAAVEGSAACLEAGGFGHGADVTPSAASVVDTLTSVGSRTLGS